MVSSSFLKRLVEKEKPGSYFSCANIKTLKQHPAKIPGCAELMLVMHSQGPVLQDSLSSSE